MKFMTSRGTQEFTNINEEPITSRALYVTWSFSKIPDSMPRAHFYIHAF